MSEDKEVGELIMEQLKAMPGVAPEDAVGGSPVPGITETTKSVGPPRVPSGWATYDPATDRGTIKRCTVAWEGSPNLSFLGKQVIIEYVKDCLSDAGAGAEIVCVVPPTVASMADAEGKEGLHEAFTTIGIRKADGSWFEFERRVITLTPDIGVAQA